MTIAELTVCGKPAILIPLPTAIYNHQALNAQVMESAGAAVVLSQSDLNGARLARGDHRHSSGTGASSPDEYE